MYTLVEDQFITITNAVVKAETITAHCKVQRQFINLIALTIATFIIRLIPKGIMFTTFEKKIDI